MSHVEHTDTDFLHLQTEYVNQKTNFKTRITNPLLTKYEKARILGLRATQISKGAKPTIDVGDMKDALKIAEQEFLHGDIPIIIRRHMPDGSYEDWTLKELK